MFYTDFGTSSGLIWLLPYKGLRREYHEYFMIMGTGKGGDFTCKWSISNLRTNANFTWNFTGMNPFFWNFTGMKGYKVDRELPTFDCIFFGGFHPERFEQEPVRLPPRC